MKKNYTAFALTCLSLATWAQSDFSFKLYSHAPLFDTRTILGFDEPSGAVVTFGGLAPAVLFQSENGLYQEIELSRLYFREVQNDIEAYEKGSLALRYEAGYSKVKNNASKMRLRCGLSLSGYLYYFTDLGDNFGNYPTEQDGVGWVLSITPHLEVHVIKNLFFDFSPFLDVANLGIRRELEFNPFFEEEQIESIDFLFSAFRPRLRAGFGWRF